MVKFRKQCSQKGYIVRKVIFSTFCELRLAIFFDRPVLNFTKCGRDGNLDIAVIGLPVVLVFPEFPLFCAAHGRYKDGEV